ncbi:MAG: hypothetical protein IT371_15860 [Deltaproteobacteria bacterium]|nr:hypothetical protein [Deltaproteobacteria bacterium]
MDETNKDPRRQRCEALAGLLTGPDGLRTVRLLQATGTLTSPPMEGLPASGEGDGGGDVASSGPEASSSEEDEATPIGIWNPVRGEDGELRFERSYEPHINCDEDWSCRQTLYPRRGPLPIRVCYFGESAAAGLFHLPERTLASLIEDQLQALRGPGIFEIIDLTRIAQTPSGTVEIALEALQLKPDIMVFMTGNNWPIRTHAHLDVSSAQGHAEFVREGGIPELARAMVRRSATYSDDTIHNLNEIVTVAGIKGVFVIPEDNLADWEARQPVCWLPGGGTAAWHALYQKGQDLLAAGEYREVVSLAERMIELDGGMCASSQHLLGRALLGLGQWDEAERAFRRDAAASGWDATIEFPARLIEEQAAIFRESEALDGWTRVDLPKVFAEYTGGPVPGRRLFLDYCHMSYEGLRVTAAAVAAGVLRAAGSTDEREVEWRQVLEHGPALNPPSAELRARAYLHAASHNVDALNSRARRGDLADFLLEQAVTLSPSILDTMVDFALARLARCSPVLAGGARRVYGSPYGFSTKPYGLRELSGPTIRAILRTLERHGRSGEQIVEAVLRTTHGRRSDGLDLADEFYCDSVVRTSHGGTIGAPFALRAWWPDSSFFLPTEGGKTLEAEITLRLSPASHRDASPRSVGVLVNGQACGTISVATGWTTGRVRIDAGLVRRGINDLVLRWPLVTREGEGPIAELVERLERGLPAHFHPVFGEVASLVVRGA